MTMALDIARCLYPILIASRLPDRRTHTQEVPDTGAVPHRPDIHQPPLAAALQ
jgi:hypothetical protein